MTPQYLRVKNYERYQHYKDRRPPWVKFYIELLDDYSLNRQKPATRLLAVLFLLLAATHDNRIPNDVEWIASKAHMKERDVAEAIETLVSIGFLTLAGRNHSASKEIAKRSKSATPETETKKRQRKKAEEEKGVQLKAVTSYEGTAQDHTLEEITPALREIA